MNLEKIINDFAEEYTAKSVHATKEEVQRVLEDAARIINANKDKTPEEIVAIMIDDAAKNLNSILQEHPMPGIASSLKIDNINVNMYGGNLRPDGKKLETDALFDVASITKLYTEIVAYKLIAEGAFKL